MRAAPQNRKVTLMRVASAVGCSISRRSASANNSSSAMALVGCGTLSVERMVRMPALAKSRSHRRRKQRVGDDRVDRVAPAASSALAQAISVPPEETMSSTSSAGRPAIRRGIVERDLDRTIAAAQSFAPPPSRSRAAPASASTHGSRFRVRSDHHGGRIDAARCAAYRRSPASPTDSSASMPGNTSPRLAVRCRCGIDGDDAVDAARRAAGRPPSG